MARLADDRTPPDVAVIVSRAAEFIGVSAGELFVADHTHEELSEGAFSIAYEGAYEWPYLFMRDVNDGKVSVPPGWLLEPGTGWFLAVYPAVQASLEGHAR